MEEEVGRKVDEGMGGDGWDDGEGRIGGGMVRG